MDPAHALHGHGFEARVVAPKVACRPRFSGDEAAALGLTLAPAVAALDYRMLNDRIGEPDDARIAEWLLTESGLAGDAWISLQSAPDRGAMIHPDGSRAAWRRFRFEAAHRLPNVPEGHKCGRMHGHGFAVTLYSAIEAGTDAWRTQEAIAGAWRSVRTRLHLSCLNDLPGLENPTSEVLARWIWQALKASMPALAGVSVMETDSAGCHFDGAQWQIWKAMSFDSAVRLARAPSDDPRRLIHGHTFTTRLHLSGDLDDVMGWVHDYGDVKRRFNSVFRALDHQALYEHTGMDDNDAASIARHIDREMSAQLPGLSRIDLLDTPGCGALLCHRADNRGLLVS